MNALRNTRLAAAALALILTAALVPQAAKADVSLSFGATTVGGHRGHCHYEWRHHHKVKVQVCHR
jgi:hypothetical protein